VFAVILAGGRGQRFWPASNSKKPKQYLSITGDRSMLSVTYRRLASFIPPEKIIVITVREQIEIARDELPDLPGENFIAEPDGRNTAPALALGALAVMERSDDEPMLTCPADHLISREDNFRSLAEQASRFAERENVFITFGIMPEYPATGYGYIEAGDPLEDGELNVLRVVRFHEKPDRETAQNYLSRGGFYWNSGIFLWRPSVFLEGWSEYLPSGSEPLRIISESVGNPELEKVIEDQYPRMPSISVDYGILEKADNVAVVPADLGWNDVGSWDSLYDIHGGNGNNNVSIGVSETIDTAGCVFYNPGGFTAAIGVEDIMVISRGGIVLVCRRGQSQKVRDIVELIEEKGYNDIL